SLSHEKKPSYLEYLESEKAYFQSPRFEKDEEYWLNKFETIPELTALKNRKQFPTLLDSSRLTFRLPEKLCSKIRPHCEKHKTSIFSLYMGAMAVYINRTKGINKIIFGTPVLNRKNPREKNTMGMYVSTVPLVVDVDDSKNYSEFTEGINQEWMTLLRHQKYPYMLLLKKLREKNPGLEKLYDIVISYQNAKFIKTESDHFQEGRWHQNSAQNETLYIHINDREDDGDIIINYDYLTELFYEKEIEFLHDHVIRLLWHFIDNPQRQIPYIEMISENEKQKILYDFNNTIQDFSDKLPVHRLFEINARHSPDKTAVVFEDVSMSYGELNEIANRVAWTLMKKGIGAGDVVGFMLPRSFSIMAAIFGILKSGAAYMPIDRNFPADRIIYMLENSKAKAIITEKGIFKLLDYNGYVIDIEQVKSSNESSKNPKTISSPDDPALIIYTSGSTGKPKGVTLTIGNLMNFVPAMKCLINLDPSKTALSIATESFDFFVSEAVLPLTQGLRLIMTNENEQKIPQMLHELMLRYKVDILQTTPTRMNYILNHINHYAGFEDLQEVIMGGEVFKDTLLKKIRSITKARIYNGYGPTETTVFATFKELTHTDVINIGKPLPNTRIYIVDKYMNLMPIGTIGELCIGGDGLMKGYVNNKILTDEKLIECPFEPGKLMYRTGDLASWYSQGDIEFFGRNDNQIKINGLRIEYGEIETHILKYGEIREAVVSIWEDDTGKPIICAYYVADTEINSKDIREKLSEKLPVYMIPSYFIRIKKMPLTTSGKVARTMLPEPIFDTTINRNYEAPVDRLDHILCDAYETILKFAGIGINDHFFELGGDSLGVIELVSILYKKGYEIKIGDVYKYPVICELKKHVSDNRFRIVKPSFYKADMGITNQSIDRQILSGNLAQIDSAAITYVPDNNPLWYEILSEKPVMYKHMALKEGNIGIIAIPLGMSSLYSDRGKTIAFSVEAARIAEASGAKVISLTGLIPSATNRGLDIAEAIQKAGININVTTGHPTTAASVVLSLVRLLGESSRNMAGEDVCVLGVGSIGSAVTKLVLEKLPHPASIILCDLPGNMTRMEKLKKELRDSLGFEREIKLSYSDGSRLPSEVYKSTLIIGATNAPDVLDIDSLHPGTLIIDDSGPHCFKPESAIERIMNMGDLLATEGGVLEVPGTIKNKLYLPGEIDESLISRYHSHFASETQITGCILSSLMTAVDSWIKPSVGEVDTRDCVSNYSKLAKMGYKGANLHIDDFVIPEIRIDSFKQEHSVSRNARARK
ncbi:MAG: amino acid adenylation domain-containing protein, partial [Clostridia bacterium]|nr:amino acid adenylation domain-containing protein [Clostridia bacterium]